MTFGKKKLIGIISLIIIFIMPTNVTLGALWEEVPFQKMVKRADLIIIGTITGNMEERLVEHPETEFYYGYTDWEIEVTNYLKGKEEGERVFVTTPGVSFDYYDEVSEEEKQIRMLSSYYNIESIVSNLEYELGVEVTEVLFFLEEREGYWEPITPKAVVPLVLLEWEDYLTEEIIGEEEIEFEEELFQEMVFLKNYVESATSGDGNSSLPWVVGGIILMVIGGGSWGVYTRRNSTKKKE